MNRGAKTNWVTQFLIAAEISDSELQEAAPVHPALLESLRAQHTNNLDRLAEADGVGPYGPMAMSRVMNVWSVRIGLGSVMHQIELDLMNPIEDIFSIVETTFMFPVGVSLDVVRPIGEYSLLDGTEKTAVVEQGLLGSAGGDFFTMHDYCAEDMLSETVGDQVASLFPFMEITDDSGTLVSQALMQVEVSLHTSALTKRRLEESDDLDQLQTQIQQLMHDKVMDDATRYLMIEMLSEQLEELCEIRKVRKMGDE